VESNLPDFIRHARQKGMDHATIRVLLLSAGWREKDIAKGLAEEGLDVAVPEPPSVGGAKEAFQYLLAFTSLCFVVVNVVYLFFEYLDVLLPDPVETNTWNSAEYQQGAVRWSMAMLIVAFPLYFGFTRWIERDLRCSPEKGKSAIRRWLTYLALFAAAVTMMMDGVALIFGFLQGDLTTRFLLRVLIVLLISALVFCYYLMSLRITDNVGAASGSRLDWTFGGVSAFLVGLAVVFGFLMVESPFKARLRRFDERRIADLREIESAIQRQSVEFLEYRNRRLKRALPCDLDEIARFVSHEEHRRDLNLSDPQSGEKYGYAVKGESSYEICAEFSLDNKSEFPAGWNHSAGKYCFVIDVLKND
jgi:Domain of unknown function (DUF5671)